MTKCTCEPGVRTRSSASYQCPKCEEKGRQGNPTVCLHESDCPEHGTKAPIDDELHQAFHKALGNLPNASHCPICQAEKSKAPKEQPFCEAQSGGVRDICGAAVRKWGERCSMHSLATPDRTKCVNGVRGLMGACYRSDCPVHGKTDRTEGTDPIENGEAEQEFLRVIKAALKRHGINVVDETLQNRIMFHFAAHAEAYAQAREQRVREEALQEAVLTIDAKLKRNDNPTLEAGLRYALTVLSALRSPGEES